MDLETVLKEMGDIVPVIPQGAPCQLYTLEGIKPAKAYTRDGKTHRIVAEGFCIVVQSSLVRHKFEYDSNPTFYGC